MPGGAQQGGETPVQTALREAAAVDPNRVRVRGERVDRLAGDAWPFISVVADATEPLPVRPHTECDEFAWIPEGDVTGLNLHPAFAARWPALRVARVGLVVDAANVVGSRPDGWWKDRAGDAARLLSEIAAAGPGVLALPQGGFCDDARTRGRFFGDDARTRGRFFGWVDSPVLVLEGAAVRAADVPGVETVRAAGAADDTIVDIVTAPRTWVVVTADRALRGRLPPHAHPLSPTTFLSWVNPHSAGSAG
jgi:8-oxo-dGTP diphosphatase